MESFRRGFFICETSLWLPAAKYKHHDKIDLTR